MHNSETPPNKVARTEQLTVTTTQSYTSSSSFESAQFIGSKTGISQSDFNTMTGRDTGANPALSGLGKHFSWSYTPGTNNLAVWENKGGEPILNFTNAIPVFPHAGGDKDGISQDPVAFIAESRPNSNNPPTLALCSTNGAVKSVDGRTKFCFSYFEDGRNDYVGFKIRSFAVVHPDCALGFSATGKNLELRENYLAGSARGVLLCVSAPAGTAPNAYEQDPDVAYLNLAAPLDYNNDNSVNESAIDSSAVNSSSGWLGSWFTTPSKPQQHQNPSYHRQEMSLEARSAYQYAYSIQDKTIRHITPASSTGVLFSIGNDAIALAMKTSHSAPSENYQGPDQGMSLVWATPLSEVTHKRLHVVSICATRSRAFVLVTYKDDIKRGGMIVTLRYDTGGVVDRIPVHLPALCRGDEFEGGGLGAAPNATLLIKTLGKEENAEVAVILLGNTITRVSLRGGVHTPCRSEDVQVIADPILAANCVDGNLVILTPEGPIEDDKAKDLLDIRARKAMEQLMVSINTDTRVTADEAVLSLSDSIIQDFPFHNSNWARATQDDCYAEHAREDRNIFSFINVQVIQRQEKHRHFIRSVLGCPKVVSKLSASTIATVISDQEKLTALRQLRDLQNMFADTNVQRETQHVLRHCILAVSHENKQSKRRIPAHVSDEDIATATPGEIFYGHQDNVVSLLSQCNTHLAAIFETPGVDVVTRVNCAIATGQIFVRVFESVGASRNSDLETPLSEIITTRIWTRNNEDAIATHVSQQVQLLSDILAHAVSTGLPMNLNTTTIGPNSLRSSALTVSGNTSGQACDVISQQVQGILLKIIVTLLRGHMDFSIFTPTSSSNEALPNQSAAIGLVVTSLLRTPFLVCNAHSGTNTIWGYPHGAPRANPANSLCQEIVNNVERLAVEYCLYDLLFAFSLADPNAIDQVRIIAERNAKGASDIIPFGAEPARVHYTLYQEYCNTINSFYTASLHFLAVKCEYRIDELEWAPVLSGLSVSRATSVRDMFLREFAPHLVLLICPLLEGESASGDASLAILRGGIGPKASIDFNDGLTPAKQCEVSCAFAKLALLAYGTVADDGKPYRSPSPVRTISPEVGEERLVSPDPPALIKPNYESCKQALHEVLLHTRVSQAQAMFLANSHPFDVLSPQDLVHELVALDNNVDAWCAAVSVCDALANLNQLLEPLTGSTQLTRGPSPTISSLVQLCLGRAVQLDGISKLSDIANSHAVDEQQIFTREIFATAQGRVIMSSTLLSGDRAAYYAGALASTMRGVPHEVLTPLFTCSGENVMVASQIFGKVYGPLPQDDAQFDRAPQGIIERWLTGVPLLPPRRTISAMENTQTKYGQATHFNEKVTRITARKFLEVLLPSAMSNAFIIANKSHQINPEPLQQFINGVQVIVTPNHQQPADRH